jgi:hypothetical protein
MGTFDILNFVFGIVGVFGTILSVVFYFRERLSTKELENEKSRMNDLRTIIHWQLQAIHHDCNRIENIMLDPERPDKGVIEVSRGIRDSVDAIMGQLLGDIYIFPWANVPIRDPKTGEEIGRMVDGKHHYKEDPNIAYPYIVNGKYSSPPQTEKND